MLRKGALGCTRGGIPQTDGLVITPTCERPSIRAERDATDIIRMLREGLLGRARGGIPQSDGRVPTPTCERPSIRTERDA